MNRVRKVFVSFLVFALVTPPLTLQSNGQIAVPRCRQASTVTDPAPVMNYPDQYAWQVFLQVNAKSPAAYQQQIKTATGSVTTNSAVWESWPDDPYTFPASPNPASPPQWPDAPTAKRVMGKGKGARVAGTKILDTGGEEVHRNKATFDYIVNNGLWYTQGIAKFMSDPAAVVDFPIDSIEVKGNWVQIAETDKPKYHWNYDGTGQLWGLVAMHISTKALPNWFWSTFEWVDNAGRCDYIGCNDCFGVTPANTPSYSDAFGKTYPGGALTPALLAMFQKSGFTGDWGAQWQNYRLKGSMTEFTDSMGAPVLVGNSVTENGFVQTASCMTCHSRAAVQADGTSAFPIFGEQVTPMIQQNLNGVTQDSYITFHGKPDPNWFQRVVATPDGQNTMYVTANRQTDFVWAIPFKANPAPTPTPATK